MKTEMIPYVAPASSFVDFADGHLTTTSVRVAEFFGKHHRDVLRAIDRLECSREFRLRNFAQSSWMNAQNRPQPMYRVTRDGFMMLAMGFTGAKAAQIKEAYIDAWNQREREVKSRETDAISRLQRELINAQKRAVKAERGWRVALQAQLRLAQRTLLKPQAVMPGQMSLVGV